jgi:hypothetical protein
MIKRAAAFPGGNCPKVYLLEMDVKDAIQKWKCGCGQQHIIKCGPGEPTAETITQAVSELKMKGFEVVETYNWSRTAEYLAKVTRSFQVKHTSGNVAVEAVQEEDEMMSSIIHDDNEETMKRPAKIPRIDEECLEDVVEIIHDDDDDDDDDDDLIVIDSDEEAPKTKTTIIPSLPIVTSPIKSSQAEKAKDLKSTPQSIVNSDDDVADYESLNLNDLKMYLKNRGEPFSGKSREALIEVCRLPKKPQ